MNGNKKINNLKRLIVVISIAILVISVILVMSIYNNQFGNSDGGIRGGRKSGTTANTEDVIFEEDKSDKTIELNNNKKIIVKADSLSDNKTVKTNSNKDIVYNTNIDNKKYVKSTIVEKDKNSNVIKEETLGNQVSVSTEEEETVIISSSYIETLEPAVYTLTIIYTDADGNEQKVEFTFTVDEPWPEETTTTTVAPGGSTTTTVFVSSTKITKTRTIPPTSGTVIVTQPPKNYTLVTSGGDQVDWDILSALNARRTKPLKMAKELRDFAKSNASKALASFKASMGDTCNSYVDSGCRCDIDPGKYDNVSYCASSYRAVDKAVEQLVNGNPGILDSDYEWVGIAVSRNGGHTSWVVTVD